MTKEKLSAGDLVALIRARHEASAGWHVLEQVRNGTGWQRQTRTADAFAIQTFPSRGICAHGFEVKVDRADLVKELREPKKADAIQRWCRFWWLVMPDEKLLADLVLPETWGILVVKKGKLAVHRDAPELEPEAWTPAFFAALVRAFQSGMVPKREIDELRANVEAEAKRLSAEELENRTRFNPTERALKDLREQVEAFRVASGVDITATRFGWEAGDIGEAVRAVVELNSKGKGVAQRLDYFAREAKAWTEAIARARAALNGSTEPA